MEQVLGVVRRLDLSEPIVGVIAVGLAHSAGVVIGIEEVHIDVGAVRLEGSEKLPCPRPLGSADRVGLRGKPCRVDDDVVVNRSTEYAVASRGVRATAPPMWNIAAYDLGEVAR